MLILLLLLIAFHRNFKIIITSQNFLSVLHHFAINIKHVSFHYTPFRCPVPHETLGITTRQIVLSSCLSFNAHDIHLGTVVQPWHLCCHACRFRVSSHLWSTISWNDHAVGELISSFRDRSNLGRIREMVLLQASTLTLYMMHGSTRELALLEWNIIIFFPSLRNPILKNLVHSS